MKEISLILLISVVIRIVLLVYGSWQDENLKVKYTDVDYFVFSDAARFVWNGGSPFERSTYRYTPILSYLLVPNEIFGKIFGKLLFVLADLACGVLIYRSLVGSCGPKKASIYSSAWLLNPMVFAVSTRGNAEPIVCYLVLQTLSFISSGNIALAAIVYGFTVHFKIFPIIYCVPFVVFIGKQSHATNFFSKLLSKEVIKFALISAFSFFAFTGGMYLLYGDKFLYESLLYHLIRKDHRHNFSIYFYSIYLQMNDNYSTVLGLLSFLPQFLTVAFTGLLLGPDIYFATFIQTFIFVTFNKVCTSQYFLWYICLLPTIIPKLSISSAKSLCLISSWFASQGIWLYFGYNLEFLGENTFLQIWISSCLFFVVNVLIVYSLISSYSLSKVKVQ